MAVRIWKQTESASYDYLRLTVEELKAFCGDPYSRWISSNPDHAITALGKLRMLEILPEEGGAEFLLAPSVPLAAESVGLDLTAMLELIKSRKIESLMQDGIIVVNFDSLFSWFVEHGCSDVPLATDMLDYNNGKTAKFLERTPADGLQEFLDFLNRLRRRFPQIPSIEYLAELGPCPTPTKLLVYKAISVLKCERHKRSDDDDRLPSVVELLWNYDVAAIEAYEAYQQIRDGACDVRQGTLMFYRRWLDPSEPMAECCNYWMEAPDPEEKFVGLPAASGWANAVALLTDTAQGIDVAKLPPRLFRHLLKYLKEAYVYAYYYHLARMSDEDLAREMDQADQEQLDFIQTCVIKMEQENGPGQSEYCLQHYLDDCLGDEFMAAQIELESSEVPTMDRILSAVESRRSQTEGEDEIAEEPDVSFWIE